MNEQAIQDAYNLFVQQGYNQSIDDFKKLIASDTNALNDSYNLFKSQGYAEPIEDYKALMGLGGTKPVSKKKDTTALFSEGGSLASQEPKEEVGIVGNIGSALNKSILKNIIGEPAKAIGTFLQGTTKKVMGGTGEGAISNALIKFGNSYNKIIDDLTPQDEEFKGTLTDQFAQAFGQVASLIATQGLAGAVGKAGKAATALEMAEIASKAAPTAGAAATALKTVGQQISAPASISAGLAMGQAEFERAKEAGATDDQAFNAFLKNASVGSVLETIPVMGFLKRFEKASAGGISNYLKTKAVGGLVGGTEEMTTEVIQQLYANGTARDIYNVNQDLFEGVAESGGVGFVVGFLLNAMGANAKILRKEGKKAEADMVEKQIQEFETQAKNGGPASYKLNGLTLKPDVAIPIIEKMDGTELAKANLEIVNDPELKATVQQKIVTSSVKEQVRQGSPDLNEPSLNAITDLELELKKLEGNTTQTGKDKAAAIRQQIKNIQENPIKEEAVAEAVQAVEAPEATQKRIDRISELEDTLSPESTVVLEDAERLKLQTELQTLKTEQDAIQKQATNESVLRTGQPEVGLQQVVEGNVQPEVATTGTEEVAPTQPKQEVVLDTLNPTGSVFSNYSSEQIDALPLGENITTYNVTAQLNPNEKITVYRGVPNNVNEIKSGDFVTTNKQLAQDYAGTGKVISMEVNASDILDDKTEPLGEEYILRIPKTTVSLKTQEAIPTDLQERGEPIQTTLEAERRSSNGERIFAITEQDEQPVEVTSVEMLRNYTPDQLIAYKPIKTKENGQPIEKAGPVAGNRLFNKPLTRAKEIANRYYKRVFGAERPKFAGTRKLDEARAKRISDAFVAMKNNPSNPKVKAAYEALAKETLDQYQDFLDAGYTVEINNEEPYANSQEMIDDLRDNNRIKIFSTESGFGSKGITEKQRKNNPLLKDSGFKDINGKPLLINDVFRAIHDFYGHAELGNSFGPKGEENAWNIHARMFSPLARRAMTTETRGQNSYVNFSGVNERIEALREEARKLRESGDEAGAKKIAEKIYEEARFADQKIGLLPEEFSQFDEEEVGDITMRPEGLQERDVTVEEVFQPITAKDVKTAKFNKNDALDYIEDEKETESGRTVTYLSSITVEATNADGDSLGTITKVTDEDNIFYFTVEDVNGNEIGGFDGFETLGDAKKALTDSYNKIKQKEFNKEAKKKAKVAEKAVKKVAQKEVTTTPQPQEQVAQEEVSAEEKGAIDELMDLDVTDEDNLKKIFDVLDNLDDKITKRLFGAANDAMLGLPLSTVQLVVKTLKALVKGGMVLRDAIKKVAADNNISQETVKDIINISPIQEGFNALMGKVDELIARQKKRGIEEKKIVSNLDTLIRKSEVYDNANDAQKKIMEREGRAKMNARERRAPSIGRILGVLKDITNVSRQDKLKVISEIRKLAKDASKDLAKEIRDLASIGKITANQAANIVARFGKVNMLSEISVSKFVDYMTKVFNDAEYSAKLGQANQLKKDISKLAKDKNKNANLRDLSTNFIEIDPSMVDDIDAYNDMASKIKEAIKGSTIRGEDVTFAEMVNIDEASNYINETMESQDEKIRQEKIAEIQDLLGVDVSEFSYDDIVDILQNNKPTTEYNEGIIRSSINKMFNIYSTLINESIDTGKDPFTGEDVEYSKKDVDLIKQFMGMDLSMLTPKEALQAVDALANFLQNQSTAKMESVVKNYEGIIGAKEIQKSGIKASPLKKYNMEWLGQLLGNQFTNLNILIERMFKGFRVAGKVMDKMGLSDLINNKAASEKQSNNIIDKYVEQFYNREANGESYNSEYNNTERGLAAFMMRNVIGTAKEMQEEFNRRKNLIKESIQVLSEGNEQEQKKAELYQQVYDKIFSVAINPLSPNQVLGTEPQNAKDISERIDKNNLEGIDFWTNQWADKYEQMADVSENVYNTVLDKDLNYTPDRYSKLSSDTGVVELKNDESAFHGNNGGLYKKESSGLMAVTRGKKLPTNPKNGVTNRYVDLSFDNNNANSMYDALVDISTAAPIRQIEGFLNSKYFKNIVPNSDNATILKGRIDLYVRNIRNKNPYSSDEMDRAIKQLNRIAAIGVGQALGGPTQVLKQVIPVAINTIANAGTLDLSATLDEDKNNFIQNSGYAIANRGIESQAQVKSINRLIEEAAKTKGQKLLKGIEKANEFWLKNFLINADVYIAKASWLTYYEQELKNLGIDPKGIDYKTHKLNKQAADYAQRMVDRQQNVSDSDLAGKIFASKDAKTQAFVKGIMPFASFRMNQSARLGADLATLTSKTATEEDKKIAAKSLSGYAVEAVTFRLVGILITTLLGAAVRKAMGKDETEEEKKKRISNLLKGARTGTFTDLLSPLPLVDKFIQMGASPFLDKIEKETKLPVSIYGASNQDILQSAGLFGIAAERLSQTIDVAKLAATGKYTDDFGKEKSISDKNRRALGMFVAPAILSNFGLAPSEVNTAVRYAIKDAKAKSKTYEDILKEQEKQEETEQRLESLEKLKTKTRSREELDAIENKIDELEATPEEKKLMKLEDKIEKAEKDELLTDPNTGEKYDNESKLKRYNPRLYQKNFGVNSQWYKEHKAEKKVQEKLSKEMRRLEDLKYKRNSDGTLKRR